MSKQTAVKQLIHEMKLLLECPYVNPKNALNDCIDLAYNKLQMEKEQIADAWLNGMKGEMIAPLSIDNYKPEAEEYYQETYGGQYETK